MFVRFNFFLFLNNATIKAVPNIGIAVPNIGIAHIFYEALVIPRCIYFVKP